MLNRLMQTHTVAQRAIKGPQFKKSSSSMSQRQAEAFQGASGPRSGIPNTRQNTQAPANIITPIPQVPEPLATNAFTNNQMVPYSPEVASNLQQIALMMANPLFRTMTSLQAQITPVSVPVHKEDDINDGKNEKAMSDNQEEDESPPKSRKGKEKMVEQSPTVSKRRKNNKNGALKIHG